MDLDEEGTAAAAAVILIAMVLAVGSMRNQRRRVRSVWTRPWIQRREGGRGLLNMVHRELAVEDADAFRNFMRMTEDQFHEILGLVRGDIEKQDTTMRESVSAEKRYSSRMEVIS
jgi:hypothetical protein